MSRMTSVQVPEDTALDRLEAEFLRSEAGFGASRLESLLQGAEISMRAFDEIRGGKSTKLPTHGNGCCK